MDSYRSVPNDWTTRIPARTSCTRVASVPAVSAAWVVTRFSRFVSRTTGMSVTGMTPKTMNDIRQSSTKQFTIMTTSVRPSRT